MIHLPASVRVYLCLTAQELGALLSGIDLHQTTRRKRYQRPE
jgi:hypothetical protein